MNYRMKALTAIRGMICLFLLLGAFSLRTNGQAIIPTLTIQPPYSSVLSDYSDLPNKVMINLLNNNPAGGNANVYLQAEWMYLPEKFTIKTNYKPASPIVLLPLSMKTLTPFEVKNIFSPGHLVFDGITKQEVMSNGLPEGTYRVCIKVFDFNTNTEINTGGAGCMTINIINSEPPTILNPVCDDSVKSFLPQQVIFSWTPPTGVIITNIRYTLRMAKVEPDGTDPHQAMASATFPYFYELKDINGNTFFYGPAQPPLEKGKTYAFTITAYDQQGKSFFKNNGTSEVCWFKYGNTDTTHKKGQEPEKIDTSGKITTSVSGKLFYAYGSDPGQSYLLRNTVISLKIRYYKKTVVGGGGQVKYTAPKIQPSAYYIMTVKQTKYGIGDFKILDNNIINAVNPGKKENKNAFISINSLLSDIVKETCNGYFTTTNNNGEFAFILKLNPYDTLDWIPDPQDPSEKLYKVYYLEVINPYYEKPDLFFLLRPGEMKELGSVVAPVKTYNLNVNVRQIYQGQKGKVLDGMVVFVLRKNKNADLPEKEGDVNKNYPQFFGYTVVAKANTPKITANKSKGIQENSITFTRMVANLDPGDEYVLYAAKAGPNSQSDFSGIHYYASDKNSDLVPFSYVPAAGKNPVEISQKTLYCIFQNPPVSKVSGTLKYQYPGDKNSMQKPLKNIPVSLVVLYKFTGTYAGKTKSFILNNVYINNLPHGFQIPADNGQVLATGYTGNDGKFSLNFYNLDSVKVVEDHFANSYTDVQINYNGKLERVIRLVVQSPYYCSPDDDIKVQPWNNYDAGVLYSSVMNYNLKIKVRLDASFLKSRQFVECNPDSTISGVNVALYRNYMNPDLPTDEAQGLNKQEVVQGNNMILVAKGINGADGTITFNNCIRSSFTDDHYVIRAWTSKKSGTANFSDLTYYYPCLNPAKRQQEAIMTHPQGIIVFNSEYYAESGKAIYYTQNNYLVTVGMQPRNPRIDGRVISKAAPNGVKTAIVSLLEKSMKTSSTTTKVTVTDTMGYFSFENLIPEFDKPNDPTANIVGPDRSLKIMKSGYKEYNQTLGVMKLGFQYVLPLISINPLGEGCFGIVRDSVPNINNDDLKGDPITAKVKIEGGPWVNTYNCYPYQCNWPQQKFVINAPTGDNQKLTIVPFDPAYPPRTFTVNIKKANDWLGYFEFSKMVHKVKVRVVHKKIALYNTLPAPVAGAQVTILNMTKTTDASGYAYFEFTNNSITNFTAKVTPTHTVNFVPRTVGFVNVESTTFQSLTIAVEDGAVVKGKVFSAIGNQPLKGAKVFVEQGNGADQYFAVTDANGNYVLNGVPDNPSKPVVHAVYSDPGTPPKTYIGKSKKVTIPPTGILENVNFALEVYDKMDLTSLLGLPVEIDSLKELNNGVVEIYGAFVNLPANPNFKLMNSSLRVPFSKMRVSPGKNLNSANKPYGEPNVLPYGLDLPIIPIKIFDVYNGELRPVQSVLKFEKEYSTGNGMITGLVRIVDNSFNFPSSYMTFTKQDFYLGNYGQVFVNDKMKLPAFKAASAIYPKKRFALAKYDASPIKFTLLGFNGAAITGHGPDESYIFGDSVVLFMKLYANLPGDPPVQLTIEAGRVVMFHDHIQSVENGNAISFSLEKWQVKGQNWTLSSNSGGIVIHSGAVKTGIVDVPFTDMTITPNELICTKYNLNDLTIGGVTKLNVSSQIPDENKIFIYDPKVGDDQKGHYKFLVIASGSTPVATFGGAGILEGMSGYDKFRIRVLSLLSNGEQQFSFGNDHPQVRIYKVAYFTPITLTSYDDYFKMSGLVDLKIPRVSSNNTWVLTYKKAGTMATLVPGNISIPFTGPGNVLFSSGVNQTLNDNGFVTDGTIYEEGIFSLKCRLYRPNKDKLPNDTIRVEVDPLNQVMSFGQKSKLIEIFGKMKVVANDWDYFRFGGRLYGTTGMEEKPQILRFTVYGEIKAEDQAIEVKNIPAGFGGVGLTYDFANSRLIGNMSFNQNFNAVQIAGVVEIVIDGQGWYFICAGQVTSPGIGTIKAGLLIGDYKSFPPTMQSTLMQFAYNKNIPCDIQVNGISGFFFTGQKTLPISIPSMDINVGIFALTFGAECGLDARLYMNFTGNGSVYGMGAMVFAHAWLTLESVTCSSASAEAKVEMKLDVEYNTTTKTLLGKSCASIGISGSISQGVLSFSGCTEIASFSVGKAVHLDLSIDNSGFKGFSFGDGNCSDPSPIPCK